MTCLIEINRASPSPGSMIEAARGYRPCAAVCLVHVVASGRPAEVEVGQRVLREAVRALHRAVRDLGIEARLEIGDAAEGLLQVAEEVQPALIVLAAHGEGDFPRLGELGRVARRVLERGRQPVLLVSAAGNRLCRPRRRTERRRAGSWPRASVRIAAPTAPLQSTPAPL